VRAIAIAPTKLSRGVPSNNVTNNAQYMSLVKFKKSANKGDNTSSGKMLVNQWHSTFISTISGITDPLSIICSSEPSLKSSLNNRSIPNKDDKIAATHITPGPIVRSVSGPGPTAIGNRLITRIKNSSGCSNSAFCRKAKDKSRLRIATKGWIKFDTPNATP
jgi:hypothetical protein